MSRHSIFPLFAFAVLFGCASFADQVTIERTYTIFDSEEASKDEDCVSAFTQEIGLDFRGLDKVELSAYIITETSAGYLSTYADVVFAGQYGDARGSITCIFDPEKGKVTDVAVVFLGHGLGGFEKRGLTSGSDNPSDWTVRSVYSEVAR